MQKFFEVANHREAEIFAFEEMKADFQLEIQKCLVESGVSRRDLATRMNCSPAWVTQALGDNANLTLETISKIFLALGKRCIIKSGPIDFDVAGYKDCNAITVDDGWRVSSPEKWKMDPAPEKAEARESSKNDSVVVSLMNYREERKRSAFIQDPPDQSETIEKPPSNARTGRYIGN